MVRVCVEYAGEFGGAFSVERVRSRGHIESILLPTEEERLVASALQPRPAARQGVLYADLVGLEDAQGGDTLSPTASKDARVGPPLQVCGRGGAELTYPSRHSL